jgi:hypothetical protein
MTLHELKIWIDGFQAALKDQAPNKDQWATVVAKIMESADASTQGQNVVATVLKEAK